MNCPVCHNEIKYSEPLALQLSCNCQPNDRTSFWQVNLYTQDRHPIDHGQGYHSPEQAWELLNRYKRLMMFS